MTGSNIHVQFHYQSAQQQVSSMTVSNRDVVVSSVMLEQPGPYVNNSSLRRKANLMRMSRSPGKSRASVEDNHDPSAHRGYQKPVHAADAAAAAAASSSRSTVSSSQEKDKLFGAAPTSSSSQSNRSTVFRQHTTSSSFSRPNAQTQIDEDESSEFFLEESMQTQGSSQQRIISQGPAGELQFKPAIPKLATHSPYNMANQESEYSEKSNRNFQNRFKNAALIAQANPTPPSSNTQDASRSIGISWDTIMDNVNANSRRSPSVSDNTWKNQKHRDYERFEDSSSVGTDIQQKSHSRNLSDVSGMNRKDLVNKARMHALNGVKVVDKHQDSIGNNNNNNKGNTVEVTNHSNSSRTFNKPSNTLYKEEKVETKSSWKNNNAHNVVGSLARPNHVTANAHSLHKTTPQDMKQQKPVVVVDQRTTGISSSTQRRDFVSETKNSWNHNITFCSLKNDVVDLDEAPFHDPNQYTRNEMRTSRHDFARTKGSIQDIKSKYTDTHEIVSKRSSLSEDDLNRNNSRYSSETLPIPANNMKGFRGFIDKANGTPALADYDSDSVVTASTTELLGGHGGPSKQKTVPQLNVGVSSSNDRRSITLPAPQQQPLVQPMMHSSTQEGLNFARIGNSLSAIVTTSEAFQQRMMNHDTFSDSDSLFDKRSHPNDLAFDGEVPDFNHQPDLSGYSVDPLQVQAFVRKYRKISDSLIERGHDPVLQEDAKKAFALFEMRSRIMETDIERGIGRCGGTTTVDDMVLTEYYKQMYRVRDAVIVSKAWRDGASPKDAFTAMTLTRKEVTFSMRKPRRNRSPKNTATAHGRNSTFSWVWEDVLWVDDTDFILIRCPSLGPRSMRGSEIFTISDCQSILLKITHERCEQLRRELTEAATRQLYAKEMMKEEAEFNDLLGVEGMMTDVEMKFITITEEVKSISKQLVLAEKAFTMVKDRIERLVQKYEHILEQIDQDGAPLSHDIEIVDDDVYLSDDEIDERARLERRAERAELKAELAAREAQMLTLTVEKTKQEAESIRLEKEREIVELHNRLDDLEKKSAFLAREYESKLSVKILEKAKYLVKTDQKEQTAMSAHSVDEEASAAKERIKARFRNRSARKGSKLPHQRSELDRPSYYF